MPKPLPFLLLACTTALCACTDIIEADLDGVGVVLLTPAAGDSSSSNQVSFRWEEVPHARHYHLQVARPDFITPSSFPLDSVLTTNTFTFTFAPGSYQWRVRAENENSHTEWYTRPFTILSSESLDGQVPVLVSPAHNLITADNSIAFTWDTLPHTVDHRFELRQDSPSGTLLQALIVAGNTVTLDALQDGHYAWGVQAQNDVPSSSEFAYRLLTVDGTAPSAPTLLLPADNATNANTHVHFVWQSGTDAVTTTRDSIVVRNSDLQVVFAQTVSAAPLNDSLGTGVYTWTVHTLDAAGNRATGDTFTFTVP